MNSMKLDAAKKMNVKGPQRVHDIGRLRLVSITEAPDISGPIRTSMTGIDSSSETLAAVGYDEAMGWMKRMQTYRGR